MAGRADFVLLICIGRGCAGGGSGWVGGGTVVGGVWWNSMVVELDGE